MTAPRMTEQEALDRACALVTCAVHRDHPAAKAMQPSTMEAVLARIAADLLTLAARADDVDPAAWWSDALLRMEANR